MEKWSEWSEWSYYTSQSMILLQWFRLSRVTWKNLSSSNTSVMFFANSFTRVYRLESITVFSNSDAYSTNSRLFLLLSSTIVKNGSRNSFVL